MGNRKRNFVEGNTARKLQPQGYPGKKRRTSQVQKPKLDPRQDKVQYVNLFYAMFLIAAVIMLFVSCIQYLTLQAEVTSRIKNIASLETQLEEKRKENDDDYTRIMTSVDLDYIKDVAINELGMVYAQQDQVILYDGGTRDYVRQSKEIPKEESDLLEQILGD